MVVVEAEAFKRPESSCFSLVTDCPLGWLFPFPLGWPCISSVSDSGRPGAGTLPNSDSASFILGQAPVILTVFVYGLMWVHTI